MLLIPFGFASADDITRQLVTSKGIDLGHCITDAIVVF